MRIARTTESTLVDFGDQRWIAVQESVEQIIAGAEPTPLSHVQLPSPEYIAPYIPRTIIGVGLNYADTVDDMGWQTPEAPYLFPKLSSSVTGPYDPIRVDSAITSEVDWEAEVGVVIGRKTRNIERHRAPEAIFGYILANDVSARDLQARDGQWLRGKGLDTFCPLGPWVITADRVEDPQNLRLTTRLNQEVVQNGNTASMIFGVDYLVHYCSKFFTLYPGDVILTGTPAGCGGFMNPPRFLASGDVISIHGDLLGSQENRITA